MQNNSKRKVKTKLDSISQQAIIQKNLQKVMDVFYELTAEGKSITITTAEYDKERKYDYHRIIFTNEQNTLKGKEDDRLVNESLVFYPSQNQAVLLSEDADKSDPHFAPRGYHFDRVLGHIVPDARYPTENEKLAIKKIIVPKELDEEIQYKLGSNIKHLTDGNLSSKFVLTNTGQTFIVDLGEIVKEVNQIRVAFFKGGSRRYRLPLYYSIDGKEDSWQMYDEFENSATTDQPEIFQTRLLSIRFLKFENKGNNSDKSGMVLSVTLLEVYGKYFTTEEKTRSKRKLLEEPEELLRE